LGRDLGVSFHPVLTGADSRVDLSAQRGSYPLWVVGLAVLAATAFALFRLRARRLRPALTGTLVAALDGERHRMVLGGRTAVVNAGTMGLPGYGEVHLTRPSVGSADVQLAVTYSRNGAVNSRTTGLCRPGGTVVVDGVEFSWRAPVPAPRADAPPLP